jgi:RecA/RadA recombinase
MSNKLESFFKTFAEADAQLDFKMAHETIGEKVPVVSTGSLALDDALSCGGLPKGRIIQYYGPPGCHAKGQGILMSDGTVKNVEDIIIGDVLSGPSGMPRKVINLIRGKDNMYKITPIKGKSFIVNENHVLTLARNNHRLNQSSDRKFDLIDVTLKKWLDWSDDKKSAHKLIRSSAIHNFYKSYDLDNPVKSELPVNPYMFGELVGNSSLLHRTKLTASEIKKIGLNVNASEKYIPFEYKSSNLNDRLQVLAGLLDSGGIWSKRGFNFISKSKSLANDIAFIARSAGLAANVKKSTNKNDIETCYKVSINGDCSIIPTKLKKQPSRRKQIKNVLQTRFDVSHIGIDNFYGFTLSDDGRYLLDDFTITHNSGKTLMAMIAMLEAQQQDPTSQQVFIDAEGTFDPSWAEILGLDTSRVILVEGDTAVNGRKCFEMILGEPKEDAKTHILKGKSKEGLLDKIMNKDFNINMIVLDSLGSIIPPGEDTSKVGKMNMSLLARFLTTTFRKLSLEVNKANVVFIVINHKRDNMDPYGADHTFSGGNTYAHTLSANVYFEAVQRKDARIVDEKENKIGHPLKATIEKSKFGPWPRNCEFKVNFSIGVIDKYEEIAQLALDYNVVTKSSSVSHEYGDKKWVGFPKYSEAIKNDDALASELIIKVNEAREAKLESKRAEQAAKRKKNDLVTDSDEKVKKVK